MCSASARPPTSSVRSLSALLILRCLARGAHAHTRSALQRNPIRPNPECGALRVMPHGLGPTVVARCRLPNCCTLAVACCTLSVASCRLLVARCRLPNCCTLAVACLAWFRSRACRVPRRMLPQRVRVRRGVRRRRAAVAQRPVHGELLRADRAGLRCSTRMQCSAAAPHGARHLVVPPCRTKRLRALGRPISCSLQPVTARGAPASSSAAPATPSCNMRACTVAATWHCCTACCTALVAT